MAESPAESSGGLVRLSISSDGQAIDDAIGIDSVEITKRINRLPTATIHAQDGDMADQKFPLSSSDVFKPGAEILIAAGYEQGADDETIFEGVVVSHGISITGKNVTRLVVECRDKAVGMTIGRRNAHYVDLADSDIISKLVGDYAGLSVDVAATTPSHGELVQYYCTDWDYLMARAEVNGLLVIVEAGKIAVKPPDVSSAPVLEVAYGADLMEFHADMDVRSQLSAVTAVAWDPKTQEVVEKEASPSTLNAQGNLDGATLAGVVGPDSYRLQTSAALDSSTLDAWAKAAQVKAGLARIQGRMRFQGSAKAALGTLIELKGVGERFEGKVFVSALEHRVTGGRWTTEVHFGMSSHWFTERPDMVAPAAAGWTAGIEGLQIGVVQKLDANPDGEPMIQVSVPILEADAPGVWARLAELHATDGTGAFFVPEIGDEVVLGFLANDPSHPIVLGSLYSSKRPPPYELTAENNTKAIVTRSELKLEFDDDKKVVTVSTPGGNTVVLSDEDESITLEDQNGNKVELGSSGIKLDSPKDITVSAKGKVSITATTGIEVGSQADVKVTGLNVNAEAEVGFVGKGNATAEVSSSGQTTVKGTLVMIN